MTRRTVCLAFLGAALVGGALYRSGQAGSGGRQPASKEPAAKATGGDISKTVPGMIILANVKSYMEGFNKQDAAAVLDLFTDDCDITEADGTRVRGKKELEAELRENFKEEPNARISVAVDSLTLVAPNVAVEVGRSMFYPDGKTLTAEAEYQVTHVNDGKRWLMSHSRSFDRKIVSPYDQLRDLEWLVGDWVDESSASVIESSYRWDANKAFLLQDFTVRVKGQRVLTGTQQIGWDPLSKKIKAWIFDSEGGYGDGVWTPIGDGWVIHINGVRSDGTVLTATNQLTQLGKERTMIELVDRIVGDERHEGFTTFIVRKPPAPKH